MLALVFQIGDDRLALDVRRIREVVPRVRLHALACSPPWLAGTFVYRGQVVPVLDLHRLAGLGECPSQLSSRIILVPRSGEDEDSLLGLLASHVSNLQEIADDGQKPMHFQDGGKPDLGGVRAEGSGVVRLLDLERLLPELLRGPLPAPTRKESP
jgi:chemotaxis-related protein WspB